MKPPVVILTDFGTTDPFVGIMKGVIAQITPQTPTIDLTHKIPPGDIRHGAVTLWQSVDYFPPGSIFLVVIDPGVGTARRAMIAQNGPHTFIAPDNGVLSYILTDEAQAWEISNPRLALPNPGTTFHGRDIFAPAAAHAAQGVPASQFGAAIPNLERLPLPLLESPTPNSLCGQILHSDHFGNLLTSLGIFTRTAKGFNFTPWFGKTPAVPIELAEAYVELTDGTRLSWASTFGDIPTDACAVILGSSGLLEIVANRQSAANLLNLQPDEPVTLRFKPQN